ncbi:hypothetical protein NIES4075_43150 [Tolypothrix sp. NIES-4075]|uniref:DUF5682 family protein n=1 Tax=Tolypothrix sp. NIES-4075 TaxID=2005459 RepID=UPI000B5CD59E|nr:DUF5682 family protein [Tolypothrix sp. NIES-4075]GAX43302.1 hypothetical protein NIES4075_43150 [Tolypothrix sp. NIES-4075]
MTIHIFGIRHHGPGSARSLRQALETLQPDTILIEGPPDAESVLHLVGSPAMQPPVALLIYVPDKPQECVYYPFAIFSPEWQALDYGLTHNIPVRFMDLPLAHRMAIGDKGTGGDGDRGSGGQGGQGGRIGKISPLSPPSPPPPISPSPPLPSSLAEDPLSLLGKAAGYSDGDRWWEHMVEQRHNSVDLFAAILEAMTAVRQDTPPSTDPIEAQREAYMRKTIREAEKTGFQRIAVVCGAWHAPALSPLPPVKEDTTILKGLPKIKVEATWIPWTYRRLSYNSGYGAGIESPGWYHHLWEWGQGGQGGLLGDKKTRGLGDKETRRIILLSPHPPIPPSPTPPLPPSSLVPIRWLTQVAHLLRQQGLDASSAHVIEAVRLAESLAALRNRSLPGLFELNEATQAVLCFGSDLPMRLIHDQLIVGDRLGKVPPETPMVPLQQDLIRQQKRLRIAAEVTEKTLDLDLRNNNDLERSHLLHRLNLLEIPWGQLQLSSNKKGTFHEFWRLQWHPEFAVSLIEAGIWGNTVKDAAANIACNKADAANDLPTLTTLLNQVILSDLADAVSYLMSRLENAAALVSDVTHLMAALPPLANVLRYGNVRSSDTKMITHVVDKLVTRICISLPGACISLDDDAAAAMYDNVMKVNSAIALLQNEEHITSWQQVLSQISDNERLHKLIAGCCCRLLLDAGIFNADEAARRMKLALSLATVPPQAAAWVEGFLKGSGLLLLHDDILWQVLDNWITQLPSELFTALLPLLRRTFSNFSASERRQIGEKVKLGLNRKTASNSTNIREFDEDNAAVVLPIIAQLLGV